MRRTKCKSPSPSLIDSHRTIENCHYVLQDVIFSFPVTCSGGTWTIKQGLKLDEFSKGKLEATGKELVDEKALALECLNQK